ncbi:MAG TPA: transglutaminase-like cysteine peptidase [Stellaceae bacterium]|nr:transglutaminase-like cysteine peptidase [Stellaceae bacterium]
MPLPARARAIAALFLCAILGAGPAARAEPGLFGTREQFSSDLSAFTKWDGVVARTDREMRRADAPCAAPAPGAVCAAQWWRGFVAALAALPPRERIARANAVLNRVPYVSAAGNWHDPDHWETPYEFITRGGQCQDYAIAKFMALAQSGLPQAALRLVVVRDVETGLAHAVTVAYLDGEALVLDNQIPDIVPASRLARYVPYYSINRSGWWYHTPASPSERLRLARAAQ